MESLVLDIPFVCKSWYKATLDPLCWEQLIFPEMETWPLFINPRFSDPFISRLMDAFQFSGEFPATEFIKSVVKRSHRSAVKIVLPRCCTEESLIYVADECPGLKILVLPPDLHNENLVFKLPNLVGNWKYLEQLELGSSINMPEILYQISIHCKNFVSLSVKRADIGEEDALAIVSLLPNMSTCF
ncbi:hypothetical protein F0562_000014 [Nyssa sinensis]|uniref:F-box domain-containing protein n=1 Tax=Nyssa sinensis TaxID=561372 RepID=A0A5J5C2F3_9ASTE|nr:hypothetical protein F0562_000014 [Nyssa sinensis]